MFVEIVVGRNSGAWQLHKVELPPNVHKRRITKWAANALLVMLAEEVRKKWPDAEMSLRTRRHGPRVDVRVIGENPEAVQEWIIARGDSIWQTARDNAIAVFSQRQ